jgi:O-antigen/teichoic acid export membrane protein
MLRGIIKNSLYGFTGQVIAVAMGVASSVVLARCLGVEGRGTYAMILLLQSTLSTFASAGILPSIVHTVAAKKWEQGQYTSLIIPLFLLCSLLLFLAGIPLIIFRNVLLPAITLQYVVFSIMLAVLTVLQTMLVAVIAGQQRFKLNASLNVLFSTTSVILITVFVWAANMKIVGAVLSQLITLSLSILLLAYFCNIRLMRPGRLALGKQDMKRMLPVLSFGGKSHVANLATFLNYKADQFLINAYVGSAGLGLYSVAVGNSEKLHLLSSNIGGVLLSVSSSAPDNSRTSKTVADLASLVFYFMIFIGLLVGMFIQDAVLLLYGVAFADVSGLILLLLPGVICLSHAKILSNYISGSGRPGITSWISVSSLGVNITLNAFMIPLYGIVGAAVATVLTYFLIDILCACAFVRLTETRFLSIYSPIPLFRFISILAKRNMGRWKTDTKV